MLAVAYPDIRCIRPQLGACEVAAEQLEHLLHVAALPNVRVGVMPRRGISVCRRAYVDAAAALYAAPVRRNCTPRLRPSSAA